MRRQDIAVLPPLTSAGVPVRPVRRYFTTVSGSSFLPVGPIWMDVSS